jgi:aerobic C4-dicarboxylate transport protein
MSEARAVTNFSGNAVATVLVGTWTGSVDGDRLRNVLDGDIPFDERTMIDDGDTEDDASTDEKEPATAGAGH